MATEPELPEGWTQIPPELPEVRILRLEPGDVLAICSAKYWTEAEVDEMHTRFKGLFPNNNIALFEDIESLVVLRQASEVTGG